MSQLRSPGRAMLALNGALFGAYVAFSVQRASGSDDPRLLYPLLAIGTGAGLGAALLAAEEFDVTAGDSWYLAAGAWWGAGAGVLIANGVNSVALDDRYAWGVGGGLTGLGLATFALTRKRMDDGGAALAHSGGALGLLFGGMVDLAARGNLNSTPYLGAGLGSAIGVAGAGTLAVFTDLSAGRVLLVDLGAGLGALAGAAIGSPFIVNDVASGDRVSDGNSRTFLGITAAGTIAGGTIAYFLTRDHKAAPPKKSLYQIMPLAGVIGTSVTREGNIPAYGVGFNGTF